ncbi:AKIP protein, partial [Neodrepanis coruscans]|nr:AKIP protein [Neodrepanis coruscans]
GHLLPRSVSSFLCCRSLSAPYSSQPSQGAQPQHWHSLEPELEEILIPRRLSLSPLESWLTLRYSLPKAGQEEVAQEAPEGSQCPPVAGEGEGGLGDNSVQCKNVLKIRRRKMNRHKYKKLLKRRKFIRRRIKEGRKKRRQVS